MSHIPQFIWNAEKDKYISIKILDLEIIYISIYLYKKSITKERQKEYLNSSVLLSSKYKEI